MSGTTSGFAELKGTQRPKQSYARREKWERLYLFLRRLNMEKEAAG